MEKYASLSGTFLDLFNRILSVLLFQQNPISGIISWAILLLFLYAIVSLFYGAFRLRRALQFANRKLKKIGTSRNWARTGENYRKLDQTFQSPQCEIFSHHWVEFSESVVHKSIELEDGEESSRCVNAEPASDFFNFQSIVVQHNGWLGTKTFSFFEGIPTILTGLGILGTFIGIIQGLPESLSLEKDLPTFLVSMKGAFVTSILGLLTAIIFTFIERITFSRLEHSVTTLSSAIDFALPRKTQQDFLGHIEEYSRKQYDATRKLAMEIGQEVVKSITGGGINTIEISDSVKEGMAAGFERLSQILQSLSSAHEDFIKSANDLNEKYRSIGLSVTNLNSASEICTNTFEASAKGLSSTASDISEANKNLISATLETAKTISEQKLAGESLASASVSTKESLTQLATISSQIVKEYKDLFNDFSQKVNEFNSKSNSSLEDNLKLFDKELAVGINKWKDNIKALKSMLDELQPTVEELNHSLTQFNESQRGTSINEQT